MAQPGEPLTLYQKVQFTGTVLKAIGFAIIAAVTGPFRGDDKPYRYSDHVLFTALRTVLGGDIELQSLQPDTEGAYIAFMESQKMKPNVVTFGQGVKGCWLGDENADCVMLYLHGQEQVVAAIKMQPGHHIRSFFWIRSKVGASRSPPFYLAPAQRYPRQLVQAASALNYLLEDKKLQLSQIIVAGDSAGGNLSLALLSHINKPKAAVPPISLNPRASSALCGLGLISPWVGFSTGNSPAATRNAQKDIFTVQTLKRWSDFFQGSTASDWYMEPVTAPTEWWSQCAEKVQSVFVVAGADELFVDDIETFTKKFKAAAPSKMTEIVAQHEAHDAILMDYMIKRNPKSQSTIAFRQWIRERLQT